jgi:surface polysaccharide O-acyltransferase-like enzyme
MNSQRIRALDAARGIAMLLVCVVHFLSVFPWQEVGSDWFFLPIIWVCLTASPMFGLISGSMLGYNFAARKAQFGTFRTHLIDRALFTIILGHVAIALFRAPQFGLVNALSHAYITDTLAFSVLCGVYVIPKIKLHVRLIIGMFLGLGSWYLWLAWTPGNPSTLLVKSVFLGQPYGADPIFYCPLIPWLGLYLVGSSVGEWIGDFGCQDLRVASRRLFRVSAVIVAGAVGLQVVKVLMRQFDLLSRDGEWYQYIPNSSKYPPGSLYFFFYGGVAILIISRLLVPNYRPFWDRISTSFLEPIGRNSLVIFVLQFALYNTMLHLFLTKITMVTPVTAVVLFILSLGVIHVVASLCERYKISRFLTAGVPVLAAWISGAKRTGQVKLRQAA